MMHNNLNSLQNDPIPRAERKRNYCGFCKSGNDCMDYKDPNFLIAFLNPQGKILPPRYTGNCRKHQKRIASAVKRARQLVYLPYVVDNLK